MNKLFLYALLILIPVTSIADNVTFNSFISYDLLAYINKPVKSGLKFKIKGEHPTVGSLIRYIGLLQEENEELYNENSHKRNAN